MTTDQTPTKEQEFKHRFVGVLQDLQQNGTTDGQAMTMIGTLAADISRAMGQPTWSAAKRAMTAASYDELLGSFQRQGNALHADGKQKQAYAIQVLAFSLVAGTQRQDRDLAEGEKLLDALIDAALLHGNKLSKRRTN